MALSVRSNRFRPAYASSVALHTPSCSFRMRDCTLPRKFSTCNHRLNLVFHFEVELLLVSGASSTGH